MSLFIKFPTEKKLNPVHFNCIFSFYIRLPKYFFNPLFTIQSIDIRSFGTFVKDCRAKHIIYFVKDATHSLHH